MVTKEFVLQMSCKRACGFVSTCSEGFLGITSPYHVPRLTCTPLEYRAAQQMYLI